jgi:hypothetical protein
MGEALKREGRSPLNPRTTFLISPSSSVFFSFSSTGLSFYFGRFFPLPYGVLSSQSPCIPFFRGRPNSSAGDGSWQQLS